MTFDPVNNPDGWSKPEPNDLSAFDEDLRERYELEKRIFRQHGRCWLAGRGMELHAVDAVLDAGGLDPTVIVGGKVQSYGSGAVLGGGDWLVAEAEVDARLAKDGVKVVG